MDQPSTSSDRSMLVPETERDDEEEGQEYDDESEEEVNLLQEEIVIKERLLVAKRSTEITSTFTVPVTFVESSAGLLSLQSRAIDESKVISYTEAWRRVWTEDVSLGIYLVELPSVNKIHLLSRTLEERHWESLLPVIPKLIAFDIVNAFWTIAIILLKYDKRKKTTGPPEYRTNEAERLESLISNRLVDLTKNRRDGLKTLIKNRLYKDNHHKFLRRILLYTIEPIYKVIRDRVASMSTVSIGILELYAASEVTDIRGWIYLADRVLDIQRGKEPLEERVVELKDLVGSLKIMYDNEEAEKKQDRDQKKNHDPRPFRIAKRDMISAFMNRIGQGKAIDETTGMVFSQSQIQALILYCNRLLSSHDLDETQQDIITDCRDGLISMMDTTDALPLSVIKEQLKSGFDDLLSCIRNNHSKLDVKDCIIRFQASTTAKEAWSYALRLKGIVYEIFFSQTYDLLYLKENLKPTLANIVYYYFNSQFPDFLKRSVKTPNIREYKPDFFMVKGSGSVGEWIAEKGYEGQKKKRKMSKKDTIFGGTAAMSEFVRELESTESMEDGSIVEKQRMVKYEDIAKTNRLAAKLLKAMDEKKGNESKDSGNRPSENEVAIYIIETGHQTSAKAKVSGDIRKWESARDVLDSIGIKLYVCAFSDSTEGMRTNSWLEPKYSEKVVKIIGGLFGRLNTNLPIEETYTASSEITSQELRRITPSNHQRRTPLTDISVVECAKEIIPKIKTRPSGAVIPDECLQKMVKSLVTGSVMSKDTAKDVINHVKSNADKIIEETEKSNNAFEELNSKSYLKLLCGTYHDELNSRADLDCEIIKNSAMSLKNTCNEWTEITTLKSMEIETELNRYTTATNEYHQNHECDVKPDLRAKKGWSIRMLDSLNAETDKLIGNGCKLKEGSKNYVPKSVNRNSVLDRMLSLTIPGRTGKQKNIRSKFEKFLEALNKTIPGCLKDSRGALIGSDRDIKKKAGLVSAENDAKANAADEKLRKSKSKTQLELARFHPKSKKKLLISMGRDLISYMRKNDNSVTEECLEVMTLLEYSIGDFEFEDEYTLMADYVKFDDPIMYLSSANFLSSLSATIDKEGEDKDAVTQFFDGQRKKAEEAGRKDDVDSRYCMPKESELLEHLKMCEEMCKFNAEFPDDVLLLPELTEKIKGMFDKNSISDKTMEMITKFGKYISKFKIIRILYLYAKISEAFLHGVSEMTRSAYKVQKISGTSMNMIAKVNGKRITNCACVITDSNFNRIGGRFFMKRDKAVLGQSLIYCAAMTLFQSLFSNRGIDIILEESETVVRNETEKYMKEQGEFIESMIKDLYHKGEITAIDTLEKFQSKHGLLNNDTQRSSLSNGARICATYMTNLSYWLMPCIMENSRKVSKLTQMIRYPFMLSMSEFAMPYQIGKKLDCGVKDISQWIYKKVLRVCAVKNVKDNEIIREHMKKKLDENCLKHTSLQIFPLSCTNERQFLSDIYLCHTYNKECDNYSEGSITIVEEVLGKIVEWEQELAENISKLEELEADTQTPFRDRYPEIKRVKMKIYMLLGIKNNKADKKYLDMLKKTPTKDELNTRSPQEREVKPPTPEQREAASEDSNKEDDKSESSSEWHTANGGSDSSGSRSSRTRRKVRFNVSESAKSTSTLLTTESTGSEFDKRIPVLQTLDSCKPEYVLETMLESCRTMKKFTYGSPEFVQALAELASTRYNTSGISKALCNKKNHEQISKIAETTSILSSFLGDFNLEEGLNIVKKRNATKLTKMMTKGIRSAAAFCLRYRSLQGEMENLLLSDYDNVETNLDKIMGSIAEMRKTDRSRWEDIVTKSYTEVISTHNAMDLFMFIKTMWSTIRKSMNTVGNRKLIQDKSDEIMRIFSGDITKFGTRAALNKEIEEIKAPIEVLTEHVLKLYTNTFISNNGLDKDVFLDRVGEALEDLSEINKLQLELEEKIEKNKNASWPDYESKLKSMERDLHAKYSKELMYLTLLQLTNQMMTPLTLCRDKFNASLIREVKRYLKGITIGEKTNNNDEDFSSLDQKSSSDFLRSLFFCSNKSETLFKYIENDLNIDIGNNIGSVTNYIQLLMFNISRPVESKLMGKKIGIRPYTDLESQLKDIIANTNYDDLDFDYAILTVNLVKGSLLMARKLLDRKEKGIFLPRSPRSKVIYEMVKKAKTMGTTSVQEMAFQLLPDPGLEFCAGSAGKDQIGSVRDLQILEVKTKICIHVTEALSKSLMEACAKNDGLTTKDLKEKILTSAKIKLETADNMRKKIDTGDKYTFHEVLCVSGDCTKWGPIHCTSYFSLIFQQLLKEHGDWKAVTKLVMLKSLIKKVEIPVASQQKLINSALMDRVFRSEISKLPNMHAKDQKKKSFSKFIKSKWKSNKLVQKLVDWYLNKDMSHIVTYNHMGQGIHHGTSSLLGNVCGPEIDRMVEDYISKQMPGVSVNIEHAGSSDDFSKIITMVGSVDKERYADYKQNYETIMRKSLNYMNGLMRAAQMQVSDKSVAGSLVMEFYSEYMVLDRVSPSTAKFIISQVINNTVTTPITLYQMTHVECQQAMYMGVSLAVVAMLALCKQNIFYSHCREFIGIAKDVIWDSVPAMGALYVPQHSTLMCQIPAVLDLEKLNHACNFIKDLYAKSSPETSPTVDALEQENPPLANEVPSSAGSDNEFQQHILLPENYTEFSTDDDNSDSIDVELQLRKNGVTAHSMILVLIAFKYYSLEEPINLDGSFRKTAKWDLGSLLSDPFLQLRPESVRSSIMQVREIQKEMGDVRKYIEENFDNLSGIACDILWRNNVTDVTELEIGRLQQALESKNIIWGLSGGLKELSIPLFRQCFRSYMFENRTTLHFKNTWVKSDRSQYGSGSDPAVSPLLRVKFLDFLAKIDQMPIVFTNKPIMDRNTLMEVAIDPMNMPFEISEYSDEEPVQALLINMEELVLYMDMLDRTLISFRESTYVELKISENTEMTKFKQTSSLKMLKMKLQRKDKASLLNNKLAVIIAYLISPSSLVKIRPADVNYAQLQVDCLHFQASYQDIYRSIISLKLAVEQGLLSTDKVKRDVRVLTSLCRSLGGKTSPFQDVYMFTKEHIDKEVTNCNRLVAFNTFEGYKTDPEQIKIYSLQDQDIHTIKGTIACIAWSDFTDDEKTTLLIRLMRTNIYILRQNSLDLMNSCGFYKYLKAMGEEELNEPISNIFANQAGSEKKYNRKVLYKVLSSLPTKSESLLNENAVWSEKPIFESNGNVDSGYFTFSCEHGSATCICKRGVLYLTISARNRNLLASLEIAAVSFLGNDVVNMDSTTLREVFFRSLPTARSGSNIGGVYLKISLSKEGEYEIKGNEGYSIPQRRRHDFRYVFFNKFEMVPYYTVRKGSRSTLKPRWLRNYVKFHITTDCYSSREIESFTALKRVMKETANPNEVRRVNNRIDAQIREDEFASMKLPSSINIHAAALYHYIVCHYENIHSDYHKLFTNTSTSGVMRDSVNEAQEMMKRNTNPKPKDISPEALENLLVKPDEDVKSYNFYQTVLKKVVDKIRGTDSLCSVFEILKIYGYSELTLNYNGIEESYARSSGKWSLEYKEFLPSNTLSSVMLSLSGLSEDKVTKESLGMVHSCGYQKELTNTLTPFMAITKLSNDEPMNYTITYLLSCYVCMSISKRIKNATFAKTSQFIKKIAESNAVYSHEPVKQHKINISVEKSSTKLILGVPIPNTEQNMTRLLAEQLRKKYPVTNKLMRDRLVDNFDSEKNVMFMVLSLHNILKSEHFLTLLEQICAISFKEDRNIDNKIKGLFYSIIEMVYGKSYSIEGLTIPEQYWYQAGKTWCKEEKSSENQEIKSAIMDLNRSLMDPESLMDLFGDGPLDDGFQTNEENYYEDDVETDSD